MYSVYRFLRRLVLTGRHGDSSVRAAPPVAEEHVNDREFVLMVLLANRAVPGCHLALGHATNG